MPTIGYSTGALFKSDLQSGVGLCRRLGTNAIELSALRTRELESLVEFVSTADLSAFTYISVHAPTDFSADEEPSIARCLCTLALTRRWHVIVHPDTIRKQELWKPFEQWLCIENMDKRKPVGRTVEELASFFGSFPKASLCFDIAHAYQVDPTMTEAFRILREYADRLCQLHVSEVSSSSRHERISEMALVAYRTVAGMIPETVPVILESPVVEGEAQEEIAQAERIFQTTQRRRAVG